MRLLCGLPFWLPARSRVRQCLIGPGFILRPGRQSKLLANLVRLLNQVFFATVSGSVTVTLPFFRFRTTLPVSHHERDFCQLYPCSSKTARMVSSLTLGKQRLQRPGSCSVCRRIGHPPKFSQYPLPLCYPVLHHRPVPMSRLKCFQPFPIETAH